MTASTTIFLWPIFINVRTINMSIISDEHGTKEKTPNTKELPLAHTIVGVDLIVQSGH